MNKEQKSLLWVCHSYLFFLLTQNSVSKFCWCCAKHGKTIPVKHKHFGQSNIWENSLKFFLPPLRLYKCFFYFVPLLHWNVGWSRSDLDGTNTNIIFCKRMILHGRQALQSDEIVRGPANKEIWYYLLLLCAVRCTSVIYTTILHGE